MLEYDRRTGSDENDGDDYRITLSETLYAKLQQLKFKVFVEVIQDWIPDEWKSRVVDGWMPWEEI
jgi:hypothetical protein